MQDPSDNIYYRGPARNYVPDDGGTFQFEEKDLPSLPDPTANQALLNRVMEWANGLIAFQTARLAEFQMELGDFSLVVHPTAQEDAILRKAQEAVWKDLKIVDTPAPDFVNYWQFLALEKTPSHAAQIIQDRWVSAIRDVTGTMAYDMSIISNAVIQESTLIKSFIDKYLGDLDDSSETTILRLYDDWLNTAASLSAQMFDLWKGRNYDWSSNLSAEERALMNNKKASDVQTLMHSKVIIINQQINQSITQLQKNFVDYADVFYSKYYGPALDYRLQVNRYQMPFNSGRLSREAYIAAGNLDAHLSALMADQMRRHQSFTEEVQTILVGITTREEYKDYINGLTTVGSSYGSGSPGTMIQARLPDKALEKLAKVVQEKKIAPSADTITLPVEPSFSASHNELDDREDPSAHPQYLTKKEFEISTGIKLTGLDRAKQVTSANNSNPRGLDVATVATSGAGPEAIRNVAQNGMITASSTTRPANPTNGQMIFESDTKAVLYWDGKKWQYVTGGPPDYSFTFMTMGT